jgi:hypothetical protein
MYIVYGEEEVKELSKKYLVLELDTFQVNDDLIPTYCVVDSEHIPLTEFSNLDSYKDLHKNLVKNYKLGNWQYCESAIKYLTGKFSGELDSFYEILANRIEELKDKPIDDSWSGVVIQSK